MTMLRTLLSMGGAIAAVLTVGTSAQAATFAAARTQIELNHFRLDGLTTSPFATDTTTTTNTTATGNLSPMATLADAEALFQVTPPVLTGLASGQSVGAGDRPYLGQSEAVSQAFGIFDVQGMLEFDFIAALGLQSNVGSLANERAAAGGQTGFEIYETTAAGERLLDSFTLSGLLASFNEADSLGTAYSNAVSLTPIACFGELTPDNLCQEQSLGGATEFAFATATGAYRRSFEERTRITVFKTQLALTRVQEVPESGSFIALLLVGAGLGFGRRGRKIWE